MQQLVGIERMAEILDVPPSWLYRAKDIPRLRLGRYIKYEPDRVLEWLRQSQDE
jgi:hypothetical protein